MLLEVGRCKINIIFVAFQVIKKDTIVQMLVGPESECF